MQHEKAGAWNAPAFSFGVIAGFSGGLGVVDGLVVLGGRGCFAGVAGDLLSDGARK